MSQWPPPVLVARSAQAQKSPCEGTHAPYRLAIGVMSRPSNAVHRAAVRKSWLRSSEHVLGCFIVGALLKSTPRAPWDKKRHTGAMPGWAGALRELPERAELRGEHERWGDVLMFNDTAEIGPLLAPRRGRTWADAAIGTSGLKTLPWWRHVAARLPRAEWVGKADDDTLVNVPVMLARLPSAQTVSPAALFGTIKWGCYSQRRMKFERSCSYCTCGRSAFALSRSAGEPADLNASYEGPFAFAFGWFYA
jgi:hypothetical protein